MSLGLLLLFLFPAAALADVVGEARSAAARGDFDAAERLVKRYEEDRRATPELALAISWLGRIALAEKDFDRADTYAARARAMTLELLEGRNLDDDRSLPLALGASIEVQGQALAARGARSEAVAFLAAELERWRDTSIRARIQKNLHLLSLEGKLAPRLDLGEHLGQRPPPLEELAGRPVLLFFWAHWCGDCKMQVPSLVRLRQEYGDEGLVIMGPTQRYGFATRGEGASPEEELAHIRRVMESSYAGLADMPVPVSAENFANYGSSTTPTLVLVDREGIVRLYHPGRMEYEDLAREVARVVN